MANIFDQFDEPQGARVPASIRNNNPGAQWPGQSAKRFGSTEFETLNDGQGNRIARFETPEQGAAAQFDLLSRRYAGMPLNDAIRKWSGGNSPDAYTASVARSMGMQPTDLLSADLLSDPARAVPFAKAMARVEAGRDFPMSDEQWMSGFQLSGQPMAYAPQALRSPGGAAIDAATARGAKGSTMANIFDQFDEPAPRGAAPAPGPNIFDQFDGPSIAGPGGFDTAFSGMPTQGSPTSLAGAPLMAEGLRRTGKEAGSWNNATAGLNDAIYTLAGAPVDAARWVLNQAGRQARAISGAPVQEIPASSPGGSQSIAGWGEKLGINDPSNVVAVTPREQIARAAGAGVGYAIAPEAALLGLGRAGVLTDRAVNAAAPFVGRSATAGDVAGSAVVGAASGAGAERAADMLPEQYRPLGELAGGLLAGGVAAGATALPSVGRAILQPSQNQLAPLTASGRERLAAEALTSSATDPYAVREALDTGWKEIVPGSSPTTGQMTGDMGLLSLERGAQTRRPDEFNIRRAEQNAARRGALEGIQPQAGSEEVVNTLRLGLYNIDQATNSAIEAAMAKARDATAAMGGRGTPEGYGAAIRQGIADAETATRAQERAFWKAVDPDNSLALPVTETRKVAREIPKSMPKAGQPMEGEEREIFIAASRLPAVAPFNELTALRSWVSRTMRKELKDNGQTPMWARLAQLRGNIEADIEGAVSAKVAQEADAVARGEMSPDVTMLANFQKVADAWIAQRDAGQLGREASSGFAAPEGNISGGSPGFSGIRGTAGQGRGGFSDTAGNQGVPGSGGLAPNFDAEAAGRLKTASDATKARAQTYGGGQVGQVMRREGAQGPYAVPAGTVPSRFFRPGPRGYEDAQALRNATSPEIMAEVRDYALSTLRRVAERPDGTLDPGKVSSWKRQHADALRAFPEIADMVADPVLASQGMEAAAIERKRAMYAFQSGAVARLLKIEEPSDIARTLGGIFSRQDAARELATLRRQIGGNKNAAEGLKKGILDYVTTRFVSNTEAGTSEQTLLRSDAFQSFIRQNAAALRNAGFSETEISVMRAIAADLQRANRSLTAARIPGQSNTAQDTIAANRGAESALSRLIGFFGGPLAAVTGVVGSGAVAVMRKAGLETVDDLVKDALLNPQRARALLAKYPPKSTRRDEIRIMDAYKKAVPAALGFGEDR
ncbi:hypothetical protein [Aquabacter cavernae]|uniref:hypothetical protein n=1 Tax=Aquabacter cavernae TaxID=2496029 RepID=UPI000F8DBD9E|nr:hypothetical protein [Aquabacter cavernae]